MEHMAYMEHIALILYTYPAGNFFLIAQAHVTHFTPIYYTTKCHGVTFYRPTNTSSLEVDSKAQQRSSPGLKVTIKNSDRSAPAVTIQNFSADGKKAAGGANHKTSSGTSSSSSSKSASHKINERFITDPGAAQRSEERKRSSDSSSGGGGGAAVVARRKLGTV